MTCFVSRRRSPVKEMWIGRVKYFGIICVAGVAGVGSCGCGKLVVGRRRYGVARVAVFAGNFFQKVEEVHRLKKQFHFWKKKANL